MRVDSTLIWCRIPQTYSTSFTSSAPPVSSPAPPSRPRIFATYARVSGYGGTHPHAATGAGPAL